MLNNAPLVLHCVHLLLISSEDSVKRWSVYVDTIWM